MLFLHFGNSFLFFWDRVLEYFFDSFRIFLGPQPLAKHTPVDAKAHSGRTKAHSGKHIPTNTKARPNKHQKHILSICFGRGRGVLWYWLGRAFPKHVPAMNHFFFNALFSEMLKCYGFIKFVSTTLIEAIVFVKPFIFNNTKHTEFNSFINANLMKP